MDEIDRPSNDEVKKVFEKIERDYHSMQKNREEGFYVDLDKNRKIIGPSLITKNECEKQILKTRFTHLICSNWCEVKITKKHVPLLKKIDKIDSN